VLHGWGAVLPEEHEQQPQEPHSGRLRIGDLVLDFGKLEISRDGEALDVSGLSFDLVAALAARAPNVVSHDELVDAVWSGRFVSPETITQRIKLVRQALGDDADNPTYVGLVRNRGYRILVDVEALAEKPDSIAQGLLAELGRRRVLQAALVYAAVAWSITEILSFLIDALPVFPGWSQALVAILFVVGFPVAMFLAWRFDIGPDGIRRTRAVDNRDRLTISIALVCLLGATAGLFYLIYPRIAGDPPAPGPVDIVPDSVTVLPFVDLSAAGDQAHFADGIAEELLTQLSSIDGVKVIGRSMSLRVKRAGIAIPDLGRQLSAAFVLDGSVRKQDDELRISVNLVDTSSGLSIWSQNYDREILDIFAVQEDIALSVASALSIVIDGSDNSSLPGAGTTNLDAYDAYLAGRALVRTGRGADAKVYFERAVELDPNYASAWTAIARTRGFASWDHQPEQAQLLHDEALSLLQHALTLNPRLAEAWFTIGSFRQVRKDFIGAQEAFEKGVTLSPGDLEARFRNTSLLTRVGRTRDALARREGAGERPTAYYSAQTLSGLLIQAERYDEAREVLGISERVSATESPSIVFRRLFIALSEEDREEVRLQLADLGRTNPAVAMISRPVLDEFDAADERLVEILRDTFARESGMTPEGRILTASLAAYFGAPELALAALRAEMQHNTIRTRRLWYRFFSNVRSLPAFKEFATDLGLVAYWRKYGWADVCRPLSDDDFACR
jgi:TolB-like protein/DNA-binding winged helix-turn-helix (wHTH) protein